MPGQSFMSVIRQYLESVARWIETKRIKEHLRRAEKQLRDADTSHLSPDRCKNREKQLDRLHDYWKDESFPLKNEASGRIPYFIGTNDVPCAMAALMLEDGEDALVDEVRTTDNNVWIEDLDDGPVLDWIHEQGLTQAEAAQIQPSYGRGSRTTIWLAKDCGPFDCSTALLGAHVTAIALFLVLEYIGYRTISSMFPDNPLKHKRLLAYVTVCNLAMAPVIAYLLYALLP